jgi:hypothetical protein
MLFTGTGFAFFTIAALLRWVDWNQAGIIARNGNCVNSKKWLTFAAT